MVFSSEHTGPVLYSLVRLVLQNPLIVPFIVALKASRIVPLLATHRSRVVLQVVMFQQTAGTMHKELHRLNARLFTEAFSKPCKVQGLWFYP